MPRRDHDVYVCCRPPAGTPLAATLVAGLERRGFRVLSSGGARPVSVRDDSGPEAGIEAAPDFVLVLTPGVFVQGLEGTDCEQALRHAVRAGRNIVLVEPASGASALPDDLASALRGHRVTFDPARTGESIALVAHRLSSDSSVDDRRVMRLAKRLFTIAGLVLVAGVASQEIPILIERWSRPALLAPVPPYTLYWSAVAQRLEGTAWVATPVAKDSEVRPGDRIRVAFAPSADGFAYVISRDSSGDVSVLFPTDALRDASRVKAGVLYEAPLDGGWLTVDERTGLDVIYIIGGYDALQNLEELVEEPDTRTTPGTRRELLESTVHGLLDGRHGAAERRVWTGKLHPIDEALRPRAAPGSVPALTLADGRTVGRRLLAQAGLVSASVEIRVRFVQR